MTLIEVITAEIDTLFPIKPWIRTIQSGGTLSWLYICIVRCLVSVVHHVLLDFLDGLYILYC